MRNPSKPRKTPVLAVALPRKDEAGLPPRGLRSLTPSHELAQRSEVRREAVGPRHPQECALRQATSQPSPSSKLIPRLRRLAGRRLQGRSCELAVPPSANPIGLAQPMRTGVPWALEGIVPQASDAPEAAQSPFRPMNIHQKIPEEPKIETSNTKVQITCEHANHRTFYEYPKISRGSGTPSFT